MIVIVPVIFYIFDLYYPFKYFTPQKTLVDISLGVLFSAFVLAAISYADRSFALSRLFFGVVMAMMIPVALINRLLYDVVFKSRLLDKHVLILGAGPLADEIAWIITNTPYSGMGIIGRVCNKEFLAEKSLKMPVLGESDDLLSIIDWYDVKLVVLAIDPQENISEAAIAASLLKKKVGVVSAPYLIEALSMTIPYQVIETHYILGLMSQVRRRPYLKIKRILDLILGLFIFVLTSPILILAMFLLSFHGLKNIFYVQHRIGKEGLFFKLIKLKTMTNPKDGKQKVTRLGYVLRKYRIDEIPQLLNVIKGDMSLVGPRPEIPYFVERCQKNIPFYDAVFTVRPGLTGWAQIMFRYTTSAKDYDQKFRYNLYYLKNISLALDLLIIFKTIRTVLLGSGQ